MPLKKAAPAEDENPSALLVIFRGVVARNP